MKILPCLLFCCALSSANAQDRKYYFNAEGIETDSVSSEYYVIERQRFRVMAVYTKTNSKFYSTTGNVYDFERTYYYPDGNFKSRIKFIGSSPVGTVKSYYRNGQLQGETEYIKNGQHVKILNYYDSLGNAIILNGNGICECDLSHFNLNPLNQKGQVVNGLKEGEWISETRNKSYRLKEWYKEGGLIRGIQYSNGQEFAYNQLEEPPGFPGGSQALMKNVIKNLVYPKSAKKARLQGDVSVSFFINTDGNVIEPEVIKGFDAECEKEALRIISELPAWSPAKSHGKPIKVRITIPIRFKLS